MAFVDQVQDLTSLSVSDTDELSQFLKDGVLDVTNRWLSIKPQDIESFGRESSEQTSNGSLNLNGARIISVIREDGVTSNNWRPCNKILPSQQYLVTDEESLSFASKFNPAYMVGDAGKISVFPTPGSDPNAFKVYYVNKDPVNSSGSALIHSHDDILYFPIDKVYLVIMYAGIRLLQATMGNTTITDLSITAVPPDTPDVPELSSVGTAPTYDTGVATSALSEANTFINTNEDVELATAKLAQIQALMQDELNDFNQENILFQATIQRETQEDTLIIQKYQADLSVYQAEVGAQVQEYTQNLQADGVGYQWLQGQYVALKAEYDQAFTIAAPKPQPQQ